MAPSRKEAAAGQDTTTRLSLPPLSLQQRQREDAPRGTRSQPVPLPPTLSDQPTGAGSAQGTAQPTHSPDEVLTVES